MNDKFRKTLLANIRKAIREQNQKLLNKWIDVLWEIGLTPECIPVLNELLLVSFHRRHQQVTKAIQDFRNPDSVPFIQKALESNFEYLGYTGSQKGVIAKWFSWALWAIGTDEAFALMRTYTDSPDAGIRHEMRYRLTKASQETYE